MMLTIIADMTTDRDEFELRLGRIGRDTKSGLSRVRTAVRMRSAGRNIHPARNAASQTRTHRAAMRRVAVSGRFALHGVGARKQLSAEVKYLARAGAARAREAPGPGISTGARQPQDEGEDGELVFYNGREEHLDALALTAAWANDKQHLRMVISAEDAEALGHLRPMIREIMARLEVRLAARLDWLAVDHWDTDNPHTHILVRGQTSEGKDLVVSWPAIQRDIRLHAQLVATRALGPQPEPDPENEHRREIHRLGVTALDRRLTAGANAEGLILPRRPDLIARLDMLEVWGLATREGPTRDGPRRDGQGWRLSGDLLASLRAMERHAEVEQVVLRHRSEGRHLPVLAADPLSRIEGVLVHLGPADAFGDGLLAVIETGRGELRYQRFSRESDLAQLRGAVPGAVIAFEPNTPEIRTVDLVINAVAERNGGLYSAEHHFDAAPDVSRSLVAQAIRRLEAMRRLSLIARTETGDFIVGEDHLRRAHIYEERIARRYPLSTAVLSYWSLERQVEAIGPTHLDHVLSGEAPVLAGAGDLARRQAQALQQRRVFLIEQGWLRDDAAGLSRQVMARMADNEVRSLAEKLSADLGKPVSSAWGREVRGVYQRRIDLAQGRAALVVGEDQAHLLPWRPAFERFQGQEIEGVFRGRPAVQERVRGMGLAV